MQKYGKKINDLLAAGDVDRVRDFIVGIIDVDRHMEDFEFLDVAKYAAEILDKSGFSLYDTTSHTFEIPLKSEWDKNTWRSLKIEIMEHCTPRVLGSMREVMVHLRNAGHPEFQVQENNFTRLRRQQMGGGSAKPGSGSGSRGGAASSSGPLQKAPQRVTVVKKDPPNLRPVGVGAAIGLGVVLAAKVARVSVGLTVGCIGIAAGAAVGFVVACLKDSKRNQ